ncbi:MAG: GIY-YIG nuclease family protein [Methanobacteriaceae archaeon]|jgi:Uri superfamily endonuclease|nr:GIY-YIG nuclease family protein [Methanobacteriaceae archaeon]
MKGTYCLIIEVCEDVKLKVGRLGQLNLKSGFYVYTGSALNSLGSRIKRHLSSEKKLHWHVDYLLLNKKSKIDDVLFAISEDKIECQIADYISQKGEQIVGFGCSDCNCNSHLIYFKNSDEAHKNVEDAFKSLDMEIKDLNYLLNLENEF